MNRYLITLPEFYTDTPSVFRKILHKQFEMHTPEYALYRDKKNPNYDTQASDFVEVCKKFEGMKSFIHQKVDLAKKIGATGVHLTSLQFEEIQRAKAKGLEVIISTHTKKEVLQAQALGADAVTYSPIFPSPNKGKPKGIEDLKELLNQCNIKVFALGGIIQEEQIRLLEDIEVYGFASIRYFSNT
jgi:thiamine-phosphate pyrophosphorylase